MEFNLKLIANNQSIGKDILIALLPDIIDYMNNVIKYIKINLPEVVRNAIVSTPEYQSLVGGQLQFELGIPDVNQKISGLLNIWMNNIVYEYQIPRIANNKIIGNFSVGMIRVDFDDVIYSEYATIRDVKGYSLPWLEWLLTEGNRILVPSHEVVFGASRYSRTGNAIMRKSKNRSWKVPSQYAGTLNDNSKLYEEDYIINVEVVNKRNSYKIGKIAGEILVNDFVDKGFKASSIRTTVCYGPGVLEDDSRVLSDLVKKGVYNDEIQLMDDGQSTRNFIHISDFCLMIFNVIKTCRSKVYNVNGNTKRSILEIAQIISEILNKPVVLGNKANVITENTTRSVSMSIDRYESEFGKHNFKSIEEGIKEFTEWYKTILNKQIN